MWVISRSESPIKQWLDDRNAKCTQQTKYKAEKQKHWQQTAANYSAGIQYFFLQQMAALPPIRDSTIRKNIILILLNLAMGFASRIG